MRAVQEEEAGDDCGLELGQRGEGEEGDGLELLHPALYEFMVIFSQFAELEKGR